MEKGKVLTLPRSEENDCDRWLGVWYMGAASGNGDVTAKCVGVKGELAMVGVAQ